MCGIAGARLEASTEVLERVLRDMASAQRHRGPDASGIWTDAASGVGFAHRRLSIIDLSETGSQPMRSADGRMVICFNGEVYNFQALRAELLALGHAFRGTSDTEVILAAAREWGLEKAVGRLVGMFAFALWDRDRHSVYLVRDRLGVKPLYYARHGSQWAFASELKALRRAPFLRLDVSSAAVGSYLRYGYIPAPLSIYDSVTKVPAASIVELPLDDRPVAVRKYWDVYEIASAGRRQAAQPRDMDDALEELEALIDESVRLRMIADVPVGAFLSGGIDSTTVVSLMRRHTSHRVKTFTIGFAEEAFNEAHAARAVAEHLDTDHHELYVTEADLLRRIDDVIRTVDEPFADISILPTMLVSELAAAQVKVVLSGDGGDESFCGYDRYPLAARMDRLRRLLPLRALGAQLARVNGSAGKIARMGAILGARDHEETCAALLSQWQLPDLMQRAASDAGAPVTDIRAATEWADIREYMMLRDTRIYLADDVLHKVDRASMSSSLEAREPLLDHRLIEYAWTLPLDMKLHQGKPKWPLRRLLAKQMPEHLYERRKQGFGVPISKWLRGELRSWAEGVLFEGGCSRFFEMARVRRLWSEHQSGTRDRGTYLWTLLVFVAWMDRVEDGRA